MMNIKCFSKLSILILIVSLASSLIGQTENAYGQWKAKKHEEWEKEGRPSLQEQTRALVDRVRYWLNDIKKDPKYSKFSEQQALYNYNYARELLEAPVVSHWQDIDQSWLNEQGYRAWKAEQQEQWQNAGKTSQQKQTSELINSVRYWLNDIKSEPIDRMYSEQRVLYNYNYAREILGAPGVSDWQDIDESWLDEEEYRGWKAVQQERLQKAGKTSLQEQINVLINSVGYWLNKIKEEPKYSQHSEQQALYNYNYARELLGESIVTRWQDIDESWLYKAWKEAQQEKSQDTDKASLQEQVKEILQ